MKETNKVIGSMIREYRVKKGMTQVELAVALGYDSAQFVSLMERGESKMPVDILSKLSSVLGISQSKVITLLVEDFKTELKTKIASGQK